MERSAGFSNRAAGGLVLVVAAWSLWIAGPDAAAGQPDAPIPDPETVIAEIRDRNPDLETMAAHVEAAHHVGPRLGSLPDPMFSVGLSNLPLSTDQTPLTGVQFELKQTFPWLGKRAAREEVADFDVLMGQASLDDRRNALVARGKSLLWELAYLAEQRKLALEIKDTLAQFAQVAEATYSMGSGRQQDLIRPVVAQHRMDDLVIEIDSRVAMIKSEINALRARPPTAPLRAPRLAEAKGIRPDLDMQAIEARAAQNNPRLRMQTESAAKQRAALHLAELDSYPDITVALQYRLRWVENMDAVHGADFVGVGLGLNLPVYYGSKQGEREQEVRARIRAEDARREAAWNAIRDRLNRIREAIDRDRAQAALYREKIIPDTNKTLEASLNDYRTGHLELLAVLDNLTALFRTRVDLARRISRIEAARAELEYLIGGPIPGGDATPAARTPAPASEQAPSGGSR